MEIHDSLQRKGDFISGLQEQKPLLVSMGSVQKHHKPLT